MPSLGFTGRSAEIMEIEDRGEEKIMRILSQGVTERAAVRGARMEAKSVIPIRDQQVVNVTRDRSTGPVSTRYIVTIGHNLDNPRQEY